MKVLDLFSGLGGWSEAFKDRGHDVITLDIEEKFKPTIVKDILQVKSIKELGEFDVILASPPCEKFSIAAVWLHNWIKTPEGYKPNNDKAVKALEIANHTFKLLEESSAKFYVIENPRGFMRLVIKQPDAQVNYCQYASIEEKASYRKSFHDKRKSNYFKATDLWGKIPPSFIPKRCKPGNKDHVFAGGHTDLQFATHGIRKDEKSAAARALIPYGLSLEMCIAVENDLHLNNEVDKHEEKSAPFTLRPKGRSSSGS